MEEKHTGMSIAGLVLGISSIALFLMPYLGIPAGIVGIVMSALSKKADPKFSKAGLICSIIGVSIWPAIIFTTFTCAMLVNTVNP